MPHRPTSGTHSTRSMGRLGGILCMFPLCNHAPQGMVKELGSHFSMSLSRGVASRNWNSLHGGSGFGCFLMWLQHPNIFGHLMAWIRIPACTRWLIQGIPFTARQPLMPPVYGTWELPKCSAHVLAVRFQSETSSKGWLAIFQNLDLHSTGTRIGRHQRELQPLGGLLKRWLLSKL